MHQCRPSRALLLFCIAAAFAVAAHADDDDRSWSEKTGAKKDWTILSFINPLGRPDQVWVRSAALPPLPPHGPVHDAEQRIPAFLLSQINDPDVTSGIAYEAVDAPYQVLVQNDHSIQSLRVHPEGWQIFLTPQKRAFGGNEPIVVIWKNEKPHVHPHPMSARTSDMPCDPGRRFFDDVYTANLYKSFPPSWFLPEEVDFACMSQIVSHSALLKGVTVGEVVDIWKELEAGVSKKAIKKYVEKLRGRLRQEIRAHLTAPGEDSAFTTAEANFLHCRLGFADARPAFYAKVDAAAAKHPDATDMKALVKRYRDFARYEWALYLKQSDGFLTETTDTKKRWDDALIRVSQVLGDAKLETVYKEVAPARVDDDQHKRVDDAVRRVLEGGTTGRDD